MDRREFGPWGATLDNREFTQAVMMAAALAQAAAVPKHDPRRGRFGFMRAFELEIDGDEDLEDLENFEDADEGQEDDEARWIWYVVASGLRVEPARLSMLLRESTRSAMELAAMWQQGAPERVAFMLAGSMTHAQAVAWIAALTAIGERHTVHRESPISDAAASWGVPTRVAVSGRDETAALWRNVVVGLASDRPDHFVDVTDQRGERDVEILAGPLRPVLAARLAGGRGPRARLVCVVGGTDVPAVETGPMLDVLRNELGALGVVLTAVEPGEARAWLEALFVAGWWVDAVWSHAREYRRPQPFIAYDPSLDRAMSPWDLMRAAAARAALRLEREGLDRMTARLEGRHSRAWLRSVIAVNRPNSAMGGPSTEGPHERLIGLQTALGGLGRPLTPPVPDYYGRDEQRHARVEVSRPSGEDGWRPVARFIVDAPHRVAIAIARGDDQGTPADLPFPEPDEPDPDGSVTLTIVLCTIEPREPSAPQFARIRLPARGDSDRAVFRLHPRAAAFTARVIVLHRQRVLQTLLLTQPADGPWRWGVELRVHDALGPELAEREPFDAALIVNPSTALVIGTDGAGLALLPAGSDVAARGIQEILAISTSISDRTR